MVEKALEDYSVEDIPELIKGYVDAVVVADYELNKYRSIFRKGMFENFLDDEGTYHDLIEKIVFHFNESNEKITEDYRVFLSSYGEFQGKYSRRIKLRLEDDSQPHMIQMSVYPLTDQKKYLFIMDELDDNEYKEEYSTTKKVNTIQNMSLVSTAVAEIAMDKEIRPKEVTSDMVYEAVGKEKQISKEMIDILLGLLKGSVSIEEIPNFESTYSDGAADIEDEIEFEMDPVTKAKMDAVFATFSDLELFILMKEFGFFGKEIGSMTAREMSYQDYFVDMAVQGYGWIGAVA